MNLIDDQEIVCELLQQYVQHAILFVDKCCTEIIAYNNLLPKIFEANVLTIHDLQKPNEWIEDMKSFLSRHNNSKQPKGVFWVSNFSENEKQIRMALQKFKFENVILLNSFSSECSQMLYKNYTFDDIEEKIKIFILESSKKSSSLNEIDIEPYGYLSTLILNRKITIKHFPFNYAVISRNLFTLPNCKETFPLIGEAREELRQENQRAPVDVLKLANSLFDILSTFETNVNVYSMGLTSKMVANELKALLAKKQFNKDANLLLVDRVSPFGSF